MLDPYTNSINYRIDLDFGDVSFTLKSMGLDTAFTFASFGNISETAEDNQGDVSGSLGRDNGRILTINYLEDREEAVLMMELVQSLNSNNRYGTITIREIQEGIQNTKLVDVHLSKRMDSSKGNTIQNRTVIFTGNLSGVDGIK